MVSTCHNCKAVAEAEMEVTKPLYVGTYTQSNLPRTEIAAETQSRTELQNLGVPLGSEGRGGCHGCKCAQLDELFKPVAMFQEAPNRQHSISNLSERLMRRIVHCHKLRDSPALRLCKGKVSLLPTPS